MNYRLLVCLCCTTLLHAQADFLLSLHVASMMLKAVVALIHTYVLELQLYPVHNPPTWYKHIDVGANLKCRDRAVPRNAWRN